MNSPYSLFFHNKNKKPKDLNFIQMVVGAMDKSGTNIEIAGSQRSQRCPRISRVTPVRLDSLRSNVHAEHFCFFTSRRLGHRLVSVKKKNKIKSNFCFLVDCSFIICFVLNSKLPCKFCLQFLLVNFTCKFYL